MKIKELNFILNSVRADTNMDALEKTILIGFNFGFIEMFTKMDTHEQTL